MRDPETFTVDDPRFSTGRVVGPSMLTLDGDEHRRHRAPFAGPFRLDAVRERFTAPVARRRPTGCSTRSRPRATAELRRELAGPLAAAIVTHALGLRGDGDGRGARLVRRDRRVGHRDHRRRRADRGRARAASRRCARRWSPRWTRAPETSLLAAAASDAPAGSERDAVVSNAAVLLFGGIETTEGMIANAIAHLLAHPDQLAAGARRAGAARRTRSRSRCGWSRPPRSSTATRRADVELAGAPIGARELVIVSIAGANRDPAVFPDPDRFDVRRENAKLHAAFAHGPHVCIGMHLARLEAHTAVARVLERLPGLRARPRARAGAARARVPQAGRAARALDGAGRRRLGSRRAPDRRPRPPRRRHLRLRRRRVLTRQQATTSSGLGGAALRPPRGSCAAPARSRWRSARCSSWSALVA